MVSNATVDARLPVARAYAPSRSLSGFRIQGRRRSSRAHAASTGTGTIAAAGKATSATTHAVGDAADGRLRP